MAPIGTGKAAKVTDQPSIAESFGYEPPLSLVRAAQYLRMSTEHQKYSTENQAETIQQYA